VIPLNESKSKTILDVIYKAIDTLNESLPKNRRIEKFPGAVLFDGAGILDSLGLTILIVSLEQNIEEELGVTVTLVNETFMHQDRSPFRNVSVLAEYISKLVNEKNHE
jgi:acyl carrier protein